jgi:formate dehydrogenase
MFLNAKKTLCSSQRHFTSEILKNGKILCALYDDPTTGYPPVYARDSIPSLQNYPDGQTLPKADSIDFSPGDLLGCVSGELGLRKFLENKGHKLVITSNKDGPNSTFEKELIDSDIVISQPFWPAYLTAERISKSPKLKLAITAGIGSDHVDLQAAMEHNITVAEVTYCNSISVSEHVVMQILSLVRNYIPSYKWAVNGKFETLSKKKF